MAPIATSPWPIRSPKYLPTLCVAMPLIIKAASSASAHLCSAAALGGIVWVLQKRKRHTVPRSNSHTKMRDVSHTHTPEVVPRPPPHKCNAVKTPRVPPRRPPRKASQSRRRTTGTKWTAQTPRIAKPHPEDGRPDHSAAQRNSIGAMTAPRSRTLATLPSGDGRGPSQRLSCNRIEHDKGAQRRRRPTRNPKVREAAWASERTVGKRAPGRGATWWCEGCRRRARRVV